MIRLKPLTFLVAALLLGTSAWAGLSDAPSALLVRVLSPPHAGLVDDDKVLVYELMLTNLQAESCKLTGLQCLQGGKVVQELDPSALQGDLVVLDRGDAPIKDATLLPGQTAILYLWLPDTASDEAIHHRLSVEWGQHSNTIEGAVTGVDRRPAVVVGLPFRKSGDWVATNGPSNSSLHRRAAIPLQGEVKISQRYAIDWMLLGSDGRLGEGDGTRNEQYHCFHQEAIAVADGEIVDVFDEVPLNVPNSATMAVPISLKTIGGNWVALKVADERYAMYAHLIPGSLRVKKGDRVKRGDVVGLIGNTGNSSAPHLHFHIATTPEWVNADGMPYLLDGFTSGGFVDPEDEGDGVKEGLRIIRTGDVVHRMDLPGENEIIRVGVK